MAEKSSSHRACDINIRKALKMIPPRKQYLRRRLSCQKQIITRTWVSRIAVRHFSSQLDSARGRPSKRIEYRPTSPPRRHCQENVSSPTRHRRASAARSPRWPRRHYHKNWSTTRVARGILWEPAWSRLFRLRKRWRMSLWSSSPPIEPTTTAKGVSGSKTTSWPKKQHSRPNCSSRSSSHNQRELRRCRVSRSSCIKWITQPSRSFTTLKSSPLTI